jgi:hypothetical protein
MYPTEVEGPPMAGWVVNREVSCVVCSAPTPKVATFVRWGRTTCSGISNVKELYNGWVGGAHTSHAGSGVNYLCMASSPEYLPGSNDGSQDASLIYRTEVQLCVCVCVCMFVSCCSRCSCCAQYETAGYGVSALNGVHNREAACAVCEVPGEDTVMGELEWGCFVLSLSTTDVSAHAHSSREAQLPERADVHVRRVCHVLPLHQCAPWRVYLCGQECRGHFRVQRRGRGRRWTFPYGDRGPAWLRVQPRLGGAVRGVHCAGGLRSLFLSFLCLGRPSRETFKVAPCGVILWTSFVSFLFSLARLVSSFPAGLSSMAACQ